MIRPPPFPTWSPPFLDHKRPLLLTGQWSGHTWSVQFSTFMPAFRRNFEVIGWVRVHKTRFYLENRWWWRHSVFFVWVNNFKIADQQPRASEFWNLTVCQFSSVRTSSFAGSKLTSSATESDKALDKQPDRFYSSRRKKEKENSWISAE